MAPACTMGRGAARSKAAEGRSVMNPAPIGGRKPQSIHTIRDRAGWLHAPPA
jgi:hypothetical protein